MSSSLSDKTPPTVPAPFKCRFATPADVSAMTSVFFDSFNDKFWLYTIGPNQTNRDWWDKAWLTCINDDPTTCTFIVFDPTITVKDGDNKGVTEEGMPVAFARWVVPQQDGNRERPWPDLPVEEWDMGVMGPFFGGMEVSRAELMGKRPHWMLEMLGVHEKYQGRGVGHGLVKWGCDLADRDGLEAYLDASERGAPFYQKHFAFAPGRKIEVPDRPAYGSFNYLSHVRPVQSGN